MRGIYLGLASLGLVFLGQHILQNATAITGGYEGVAVEPFSLLGFSFSDSDPELTIFDVSYGRLERLWYLGLVLVALAIWYGRNLVRSRPGRALATRPRRRDRRGRARASTSSATRPPRSPSRRCTRGSAAC